MISRRAASVTYFMTGPEGDKHHGWWRITAVDAPKSLEFIDGFADAEVSRTTTCRRARTRCR